MDSEKDIINADFDFKMQRQEFTGKVFGSLDDPTVDLDMHKLIKFQMDKQLDSIMGKKGRKLMEKMPMGGVAKGMAAGMGAGFVGIWTTSIYMLLWADVLLKSLRHFIFKSDLFCFF